MADEKLAALRERYAPKWDIYRTQPDGTAGNVCNAVLEGDPDGLALEAATPDALAEALAKLEGKCPTCAGGMVCVVCDPAPPVAPTPGYHVAQTCDMSCQNRGWPETRE